MSKPSGGNKTDRRGSPKGAPTNPPHEVTDEKREAVLKYMMAGLNQEQAARLMGVSTDTLQRHYRHELDTGAEAAVAQMAGTLYQKAMNGDTTAMIFYLKTRGKWSERPAVGDRDNPLVIENKGKAFEETLAALKQLEDLKRSTPEE